MSMDSKNLSVLAYSNGFTLWHYKTDDAKTVVGASGYFNKVSNIFNAGDVIFASLGNTSKEMVMYTVSSVESGVVSVSDVMPTSV
ncbi:MAG: hypothetical protein K2M23_00415 [Alphaproteobacteria bacterium]|nr:hypothetical protein [Alphaproteobacteria bacterium]